MSGQKQNLLRLMIIFCASFQMAYSVKNLMIQVNSTDQCFWNEINSTDPDIKWKCLTPQELRGTVKLNISSLGQCRSYSFNIKQEKENEIRMNETIQGIKLWFLTNGSNDLFSEFGSCQAQGGIMSISAKVPQTGCQNIYPVDPEEKCRNAVYNNNMCIEGSRYRYILYLNGSEWMCVTCFDGRSTTIASISNTTSYNPTPSFTSQVTDKPISTVQPPETSYNLSDGYTEHSNAPEKMDRIELQVKQMEKENKTNAAIVMGDVIGLLLRQPKNTESKDMNICYSSHQNMINVVKSNQKKDFPWCVDIPSEAFNKSRRENNGSAFVGILRFLNMENKNETETHTVLNNNSYGITMGAKISNLTKSIDIFIKKNNTVDKFSCVSWDGKGKLNWTTFGCETETIDSNTIKCSCSHLTFFSVLMNPYPKSDKGTAPHEESLTVISSIGCGISMFFLAVALLINSLRKAKSNQATKILMNMFVALFLLNGSFLSNESVANTQDNAACIFIALLLHYSMLASFTWFFIQALHMYLWLIRQNVTITNYMRKITVLGWGCPAPVVVVIVSVGEYKPVILNTTSEKSTQMCWISNFYIHYIVNISYYVLVFIFIVIIKIVQARNFKVTDGKRKTFRKQLMMVLSLFLFFGLTWSVVFFSYGAMLIQSYYIFTVLNLFEGIFLFVYYYHIRNDVVENLCNDPERTDSTKTITESIDSVENIHNEEN